MKRKAQMQHLKPFSFIIFFLFSVVVASNSFASYEWRDEWPWQLLPDKSNAWNEIDSDKEESKMDESTGPGIRGFIPWLMIGILLSLVLISIAPRKGKNKWQWFFAAFVPIFGFFGGQWLASLLDVSIKDEIAALKTELEKYEFKPKSEGENSPQEESKTDSS
jgi:hypothetical protein